MGSFIVNIDVPDVEAAAAFYTEAFGLAVGRRFKGGFVELVGAETRIYLLEKAAGTATGPTGEDVRRYGRHWCPIHLDIVVEDIEAASARALRAGAMPEGGTDTAVYGRLAMFADPFGHGFCLIEFNEKGYDALPLSTA